MSNPDKIAAAAADATATGADAKVAIEQPANTQTVAENLATQDGDKTAVDPAPEAVAPAVAAEPAVVKVKETTAPTADDNTSQVSRAHGSNTANALQEQWLAYSIAADKSKAQSVTSITQLQRNLMNLVETTVNLKDNADFMQVSQYVMRLIQENKTGAFNLGAIYRMFEKNIASPVKTNQVRFALDAYLCFAEVQHRQVNIGSYNLLNAAQLAKTPELRDRFVAYFNRISGKR